MKTEGYRRTLHGVIDGRRFQITVTSTADDVFHSSATVEGTEVHVREHGVIRSKGDAMQLAIVAVERHIGALSRKV